MNAASPLPPRLSRELARVFRGRQQATLGELTTRLRGRELGLLLVMVGVPFLIPMPTPGLSTPAGLALALLGFRFISRPQVNLPHLLARHTVSEKVLSILRRTTLRIGRLLDRWVKPRWDSFSASRTVSGSAIVSASMALAVPGPGSNVVPALSLATLGIGLLGRDGLILAIGSVLAVASWLYVGAIGLVVWTGWKVISPG